MSTGSRWGYGFDYDYIRTELTRGLLIDLWNDEKRNEFLTLFVRPNSEVAPSVPPIAGIGIGESQESGGQELVILTTIAKELIDIERYLSERQWGALNCNVITTEVIQACSRPAQGGDSIGAPGGPTGTLGCVVEDNKVFGTWYMLSCNHVLARLIKGDRSKDEEVWQPGPDDKGCAADKIGFLGKYKTILLGRAPNTMDAALVKPDNTADVQPGLRRLGTITGVEEAPQLNTAVQKEGRSTGITKGFLRMNKLSHIVMYDTGEEALFSEQLGVIGTSQKTEFAARGDSGAIVIDENNKAVGLLFANASRVDLAFCNPIRPILDEFSVKLARL